MKIRPEGVELFHTDWRTDRHGVTNLSLLQFCESASKRSRWHPNSELSITNTANLNSRPRRSVGCDGQKRVVRNRGNFCLFCLQVLNVGWYGLVSLLCQEVFILTKYETNLRRLDHAFPLGISICKRTWHSTTENGI